MSSLDDKNVYVKEKKFDTLTKFSVVTTDQGLQPLIKNWTVRNEITQGNPHVRLRVFREGCVYITEDLVAWVLYFFEWNG